MERHQNETFEGGVVALFNTSALGFYLLMTLIVLALTLWSAWTHISTLTHSVVVTLGCISFTWLNVSMLQMRRELQKLSLASSSEVKSVFSKSNSDDRVRARARWWGWQFFYSILAVLFSVIGAVLTA